MANSSLAFGTFLNFFLSIFNLWLVESADAESVEREGQLYITYISNMLHDVYEYIVYIMIYALMCSSLTFRNVVIVHVQSFYSLLTEVPVET